MLNNCDVSFYNFSLGLILKVRFHIVVSESEAEKSSETSDENRF